MEENAELMPQKNMSRRAFLPYLFFGPPFAYVAMQQLAQSDESQDLLPTGTPTNQELIRATATALSQSSEQTSFVPEGPFTQEFYDTVYQSTFKIKILIFTSEGTKFVFGTGWCAEKDGSDIYIVTNKHVINAFSDIEGYKRFGTSIWRPGIDTQTLGMTAEEQVSVSEQYDMAVIRYPLWSQEAERIQELPYEDNAEVYSDTKLLVVGYPDDFRIDAYDDSSPLNDITSHTAGEVMPITGADRTVGNNLWTAQGLSSYGGSGSPAVTPDENGNPKVIGIVTGVSGNESRVVIGHFLTISPLIEELRSR